MSHRGLRQESDKHKSERSERVTVERFVRARDRTCRAPAMGAPGRCGGTNDVHEIIPRSVWRKGYLVAENCVLVCRAHHDWIDNNVDDAHDVGLHGYSYERPQ